MSLTEIRTLEDLLQPFLRNGDYSCVAPINLELFPSFVAAAEEAAPKRLRYTTLHHILSNREAVSEALTRFPEEPCRIFVVNRKRSRSPYLMHYTVEGYCRRYGINLT